MTQRKWKGRLTKDMLTVGEALANEPAKFKKGNRVVVWKRRKLELDINDRYQWYGEYEYHYEGVNGGFARSTELNIE